MSQAAIRFSAMVLALFLPLLAGAQTYQKMDEIVAIVDEGVILRSELESTMDSVLRRV